jgi:hypothetical protein
MLDIEYVSELLVRQIFGITPKKDLVDTIYISLDEEFPMESEYEDEFNSAINLVRTVINKENQMVFKSKGNFHSLFGVCLEHFRKTGRNQFKKSDDVCAEITSLVLSAKSHNYSEQKPDIEKYADASTRSTSDKAQRAERERILTEIINEVEPM